MLCLSIGYFYRKWQNIFMNNELNNIQQIQTYILQKSLDHGLIVRKDVENIENKKNTQYLLNETDKESRKITELAGDDIAFDPYILLIERLAQQNYINTSDMIDIESTYLKKRRA